MAELARIDGNHFMCEYDDFKVRDLALLVVHALLPVPRANSVDRPRTHTHCSTLQTCCKPCVASACANASPFAWHPSTSSPTWSVEPSTTYVPRASDRVSGRPAQWPHAGLGARCAAPPKKYATQFASPSRTVRLRLLHDPVRPVTNMHDMADLEARNNAADVYLWLGLRLDGFVDLVAAEAYRDSVRRVSKTAAAACWLMHTCVFPCTARDASERGPGVALERQPPADAARGRPSARPDPQRPPRDHPAPPLNAD